MTRPPFVRKLGPAAALSAALLNTAWAAAPAAPEGGAAPRDAETREWWRITADLPAAAMEGRDTGSPGHARAAAYVAAKFNAAGLRPAGEDGGYLQPVPLEEVRVEKQGSVFALRRAGRPEIRLQFLHEITVRPTAQLPATLDAPLVFRGYCAASALGAELRDKVVVCFGSRRAGTVGNEERVRAARAVGARGLLVVDDPGFTLEPARWPEAYARTVRLAGAAVENPSPDASPVWMRLAATAFGELIRGSGYQAGELLAAGSASRPLPSFDIPARLHAVWHITRRSYSSDNVLGLLPGTDPSVAAQNLVLSAHLDGYGYGEAVRGDGLYNGTLDDAAYVATLIRFAQRRQGRGLRRPVLFAAFTGEEKGLLGATWFTRHPTVARTALAADINLDQLRPLFPLKILTMHALDDSTLGDSARQVAARLGIEIRPDREPERHLNQRADHWPFLQIGVPATGFVFGYDPGSEAERRYREWYQVRYHRPQDDLTQPMDFQAAADFNRFFYELSGAVADAPQPPRFLPGKAPQ